MGVLQMLASHGWRHCELLPRCAELLGAAPPASSSACRLLAAVSSIATIPTRPLPRHATTIASTTSAGTSITSTLTASPCAFTTANLIAAATSVL